ncbi:MAG: hypothetical protein ABSB56_07830 [Nitrososphaerales archaeon]|jgi:hypothetical protein
MSVPYGRFSIAILGFLVVFAGIGAMITPVSAYEPCNLTLTPSTQVTAVPLYSYVILTYQLFHIDYFNPTMFTISAASSNSTWTVDYVTPVNVPISGVATTINQTITVELTSPTTSSTTALNVTAVNNDASNGWYNCNAITWLSAGSPTPYKVTFKNHDYNNPSQQGIPNGVTWGVNVNGTDHYTTGPNITVNGLHGTEPYTYEMNVTGAPGVQYQCRIPMICYGTLTPATTTVSAPYVTYYQVSFAVSPPGSGTIGPNFSGFYPEGEDVEVIAWHGSGYAFSNFSADTPSIAIGIAGIDGASSYAFATIEGNGTITANFVAGTYNTTFYQYDYNNPTQQGIPNSFTWGVNVGGTNYTGTGPSITVNGLSGTEPYWYDMTVTGAPGVEYNCWSDFNCSGTVTPANATESAPYLTYYQVSLAVSPPGSGTIEPNATGYYPQGGLVEVTAWNNTGYAFSNFTSDTPSITFNATVNCGCWAYTFATINGTGTITAYFAATTTTTTTSSTTTTLSTVTSSTTTTETASTTSTATASTTTTATSVSSTISTGTSTSTATSTATSATTVSSSSSSSIVSPPVGVPQFPPGSGLAAAAIGILLLAAFARVRSQRKPVAA